MLDVLQVNDVLERAEELSKAGDFVALHDWLSIIPLPVGSSPELLLLLAKANMHLGRYALALEITEGMNRGFLPENSALYRRYRNLCGVIMVNLGQIPDAVACFSEVAWLAHEIRDRREEAVCHMNLGIAADIHCEWAKAIGYYQRAISGFEEIGDDGWIGRVLHNLAMTHRQFGQFSAAHSAFDRALAVLLAYGTAHEVLLTQGERALLFEIEGDRPMAYRIAAAALRAAKSIHNTPCIAELLRVHGIISRNGGNLELAHQGFLEGLHYAEEQHAAMLTAELLEEIAVCELEYGNQAKARESVDRAVGIFLGMGAVVRARAAQNRIRNQMNLANKGR